MHQPSQHSDRSVSIEENFYVRRVLQALHAHRTPGWQFPAHFLGLSFDSLDSDVAQVRMPVAKHCMGAAECVSLAAVAVLADVAMAAALRGRAGPSARLATLSTRLSFATKPNAGLLAATAERGIGSDSLAIPSGVSTLTIRAGGHVCCMGEASFAILHDGGARAAHPMPRVNTLEAVTPLSRDELTETERKAFEAACRAARETGEGRPFLESFWQLTPRATADGAECRLDVGMHVSNRVGDVQGGVLLGLAAHTSVSAAPADWSLLDISAQYLAASRGPSMHARAGAVRVGRSTAFVECHVSDSEGNLTLATQSTFVRKSAGPSAPQRFLATCP